MNTKKKQHLSPLSRLWTFHTLDNRMQVVASETLALPGTTASAHAWQVAAASTNSSSSLSGPAGAVVGIGGPGGMAGETTGHRNGLLHVLEGTIINIFLPYRGLSFVLSTMFEGSI